VACWRGAARRVAAALAVLVVALPSSASAGAAAAASPPPPADMGLLVARMKRVEAAVREQARETREARADARALERRVAELEAERRGEEQRDAGEGESRQGSTGEEVRAITEPPDEDLTAARRHLQAAPNSTGKVVHIHQATVTIPEGLGWRTSGNYNGGHRRTQKGVCGQVTVRAAAVQAECCDQPSEDCSGGAPRICNTGCAGVFLPFWADCSAQLGPTNPQYLSVVTMCQAANSGSAAGTAPHSDLAHQFHLVCADGATDGCVPACAAPLRGDLLLMNLNGSDTKYSCELHHGLHSWVGVATDGGYLGSDAQAFVSAVLSGAAGYYALSLGADVAMAVNATIHPGQDVRISASVATAWGSGSFTVQQGGSLSLANVVAVGDLMVQRGGSLSVSGGRVDGDAIIEAGGGLRLEEVMWQGQALSITSTRSGSLQCFAPYTTLSDAWRATSNGNTGPGGKPMGDKELGTCGSNREATGVGGGGWYRFEGMGGDALPLTHPGHGHCGTGNTGWLSGWDCSGGAQSGSYNTPGGPPSSYTTMGQYPTIAEGVAEMVACFDEGSGSPCIWHAVIGVVRCDSFLLWRLTYAFNGLSNCNAAYCTAPSGL
jgi:hypothetical protein